MLVSEKSKDEVIGSLTNVVLDIIENSEFRIGNRSLSKLSLGRLIIVCNFLINSNRSERTHMKRDIYYHFKHLFKSECELDYLLKGLCFQFQCPRHCLGIYSCSKGKVIGNLSYTYLPTNETMNCSKLCSISLRATEIHNFSFSFTQSISQPTSPEYELFSEAFNDEIKFDEEKEPEEEDFLNDRDDDRPNFVLVVEKFCIFEQIYQKKYHLKYNFILITGKGYPDLNTRAFVYSLNKQLKLKIFCLCDYNPFGYRLSLAHLFTNSSLSLCNSSEQSNWPESVGYLVDNIELIGLLSSEVKSVRNKNIYQPLSELDIKVLNKLLINIQTYLILNSQIRCQIHSQSQSQGERERERERRSCERSLMNISSELKEMKKMRIKIEIENIGSDYFINNYLPNKIQNIKNKLNTSRIIKRYKSSSSTQHSLYGINLF